MATLLVWWSPKGAPIDDAIWARMAHRAHLTNGIHNTQNSADFERIGPDYRALGVRSRPWEPKPLSVSDNGTIILASLRHPTPMRALLGTRFEEPAAVVRLNPATKRMTLTRDLLGHFHLVWTRINGGILVASREEILLAHPEITGKFDLVHIASMLTYEFPEDTSTPFSDIRTVAPGTTIAITPDRVDQLRETQEPCDNVAGETEVKLADRFRQLLEDSVFRASNGSGRIGFSLSSGLDAATIAAMFKRQHKDSQPIGLAYGYSLLDGADVDEREPARQLCARLGIDFDCFDASNIPLRFTLDTGWTNPIGSILENPYRELKTEVYRRLAAAGANIVLAGHGADQFATSPANWLWSAWRESRYDWIANGLLEYLRTQGTLRTVIHPSIRKFLRNLIIGSRARAPITAPDQMPKHLQEIWKSQRRVALNRTSQWPDPVRAMMHFNLLESADYALEVPVADRFGLEIRCPFRDWKLVQFTLSTPTYLMAGPLGYKYLHKQAVKTYLDPEWIGRKKRGDLSPLWTRSYEVLKQQMHQRLRDWEPELRTVYRNSGQPFAEGIGIEVATRLTQLTSWFQAVQTLKSRQACD